jgi:succinate dehydrogenase / fumarate reductase flavoprotein subunit
VDELDLGGIRRFLHSHGGERRDSRREDLLSAPSRQEDRFETHEQDVLVIGAGGAGLRAAIEALAQGVSVGVVSKSLLGKAHTVMAEGGIAAAMGNVDSADGWKPHFRDTMRGGKMLNNWRMAQLHALEAPERVRELEQWGAIFDRTTDGNILQRAFGGHTYKRLCHVGDRTGLEMIRTLQDRGVQQGFHVYMECTIVRLLTDGGRCVGAIGYWREQGRFVVFKAKSVVMATGGIGKAWPITSNSWEYTGDGMALAYEAGAELMDLEFVQFHPTGMVWPPGVQGILVTEAVRGEGGILRNNKGERFMEKYDPKRMELSTRDVVARSIYTEVKEGRGTPHGGAYLDISHKPAEYVKKKLPSMYHQFKELADVDITKEPMEVGPTCHYVMGGIRVEAETAQSTLPGLFAAGEAAAGLHGANRLGGNSLSDLLVFGRRAGLAAARHAQETAVASVDPAQIDAAERYALEPFQRPRGESPYAIHRDLQKTMQSLVGIFRVREDMQRALVELGKLNERWTKASVEGSRMFNPGWHLALDLKSMLTISESVAKSALVREESRGAHSRIDFPELSAEWGTKNNIIKRDSAGMTLRQDVKPPLPAELQQVLDEDK